MAISALAKMLPTSATLATIAIGQLCPIYALCLIVAMNPTIKQSLPLNGQRVLNCALLISYVCPEYGRVSVIYFHYTIAQCYNAFDLIQSVSQRSTFFGPFILLLWECFYPETPCFIAQVDVVFPHLSMIRFSLYQRTLGGGSPPVATHIIVNGSPSLNGPSG